MRVEVRCCCDPGKLLGWVELRDREHVREGEVLHFTLRPTISLLPYWEQRDGALFKSDPAERLTLEVAFWQGEIHDFGKAWERQMGLALKSNDTPIEKLRRIPGFHEAV